MSPLVSAKAAAILAIAVGGYGLTRFSLDQQESGFRESFFFGVDQSSRGLVAVAHFVGDAEACLSHFEKAAFLSSQLGSEAVRILVIGDDSDVSRVRSMLAAQNRSFVVDRAQKVHLRFLRATGVSLLPVVVVSSDHELALVTMSTNPHFDRERLRHVVAAASRTNPLAAIAR